MFIHKHSAHLSVLCAIRMTSAFPARRDVPPLIACPALRGRFSYIFFVKGLSFSLKESNFVLFSVSVNPPLPHLLLMGFMLVSWRETSIAGLWVGSIDPLTSSFQTSWQLTALSSPRTTAIASQSITTRCDQVML